MKALSIITLISFSFGFFSCSEGLFSKNNENGEEGLCIYPYGEVLNTSKSDTSTTSLRLGSKPYISYNDIISYDTVFHIIKLKFPANDLLKQVPDSVFKFGFAVTLDGEYLYDGAFRLNTMSSIYSKTCMIPGDVLDTLAANEIRLSPCYPRWYKKVYDDERYQPALFARLKKDKKAVGQLFTAATSAEAAAGNEGIEFYWVNSIKGSADKVTIANVSGVDISQLVPADQPFVPYNQIAFYDTINHMYCFRKPFEELANSSQGNTGVYMLCINKEPIFVGSFYSNELSTPCPYIHIFSNSLHNNPIYKYLIEIYPGQSQASDYRLINHGLLIHRLSADGKIRNRFVI